MSMSRLARWSALVALAAVLSACPVEPGSNNNNVNPGDGSLTCTPGDFRCEGNSARICDPNGTWAATAQPCPDVCVQGLGCQLCVPGYFSCDGDTVMLCTEDITLVPDHDCPPEQACIMGECRSKCDPDVLKPSNVGCEFWAVDLDNEAVTTMGMTNDAAAAQYAVAVANTNDFAVNVEVWQNTARVGQPVAESLVTTVTVAAHALEQINLPQREVDGCMGQNGVYVKGSGSGTFVSPHAYRIKSSGPVVAYQFNPVEQQYSNDASILIPTQTLGKFYYALGFPTVNPCGGSEPPFQMDSIPDHTSLTIIGVYPNTVVTVNPTHPIMASGGDSGLVIPETPRGTPVSFTIGPYDVVNLESLQPITASPMDCMSFLDQDGDFTGSTVTSSMPVAFFTSNERGAGFGGAKPPGWDTAEDLCCTDHLEEQMLPVTALGWKFVVSRSPVRSTGAPEPDIYRVLATVDNTVVTTSLPAPYDSFTLNAGEFKPFHAYDGFTIQSQGGAIMVGQYLVPQGFIEAGGTGDPSFTIFPAAEQHRKEYVFLVPRSWQHNYMVLAMPRTASVQIDGAPIGEFPPNCSVDPIGTLDATPYDALTCELLEGSHTVTSSLPAGLTVYGYFSVGSYAYPGGSDVKLINPVE
jgi:hypothetical protein